MPDAAQHRVEMLLRIRRRAEDDARRAFDEVNGRAEFLRGRIVELERLLRQHNEAARQELTASAGPQSAGPYRRRVAELRAAIGEQSALLRQVQQMRQRCRAELIEARNRRRAVGMLRDRLLRREAARQERLEAGEVDDTHAARAAAAERAGT